MIIINKNSILKEFLIPIMKNKWQYIDYKILIPYIFLTSFGIVMIYSASSYALLVEGQRPESKALKQLIILIVCYFLIFFMTKLKKIVFLNKHLIKIATISCMLLLLLVSFSPLGVNRGGAQRWIDLGITEIQPSEFMNILVIWYLSYVLSRRQNNLLDQPKQVLKGPAILVSFFIFLVAIQPNLGGATILFLLALVMFLASGISSRITYVALFGASMFSVIVITIVDKFGRLIVPEKYQYVLVRFEVFRNPFISEFDKGHQLVNSYYAIYNGGWFGVGLGNSRQKQGFLPVPDTDFIFSIIIEELGLITGILIIAILGYLILHILLVGIRSSDSFNSLMCIGIATLILLQTSISLGGISGLIPMTGITFPFISYGGSSLLMLSITIGFALNISADEKKQNEGKITKNRQLYSNEGK